jgi:hypothetical protein
MRAAPVTLPLPDLGALMAVPAAEPAPPLLRLAASMAPAGSIKAAIARPSGLAWASGTGCWDSSFDSMRGRTSDVYNTFVGRARRSSVLADIRNDDKIGKYARMPGTLVLSFPMLTSDIAGQFNQCVNGDFDSYVRAAANALKDDGFVDPVIRLGWEPNGNFPWGLGRWPERYPQYIQCYRRQANIWREVLPRVQLDWVNRRDGEVPYSIERMYPGNDVVDIIGTMIYDRWPPHPNETAWDSAYVKTKHGGPWGLGTYLDFARRQGKKLSVSEWAVSNNENDPRSTDNPFFIRKMHEFFVANANDIAYEAYFNCGSIQTTGTSGGFRLSPNTINPLSRAEYARLWKPDGDQIYQAENATYYLSMVETEHAGYTGSGYVNYRNRVGSYIEWRIDSPAASNVTARFRFANGSTGTRRVELRLGGVVVNSSVDFATTGAWTSWQTRDVNLALKAGTNLLRVRSIASSGGPNMDRLQIIR